MTALSAPAPVRSAFPQIPGKRRPVDSAPASPAGTQGHGRHRAAVVERAQPARTAGARATARPARVVTRAGRAVVLASRAGSVVTLASMLVLAAAAAGLSDGDAPTGDAAAVATTTLR